MPRPLLFVAASLSAGFLCGSLFAQKGSAAGLTSSAMDSTLLVEQLRSKRLVLPVPTDPEKWKDSFYSARGTGMHQAADMLVPRNTPVVAADDGVISRISWNGKGGNTIYQKDRSGRFVYYYAHLDHYEPGLKEGDFVGRGQIIAYVGTTGNAPPDCPHLHFSITVPEQGQSLSQGLAINPYDVFAQSSTAQLPFAPEYRMASVGRFSTLPGPTHPARVQPNAFTQTPTSQAASPIRRKAKRQLLRALKSFWTDYMR